jgi:hypothetical protein
MVIVRSRPSISGYAWRRARVPAQASIEIIGAFAHQGIHLAGEEVVGTGHGLLRDENALLRLELFDQPLNILFRSDAVGIAMDDEAGGRAGCQEREVVSVGLRRDRDEAFYFGAAHQELHADPRPERIAGNPAALGIGMERLHPVERAGCIRQFARAMIESALAAADAAKIEAQRREAALLEHIEELVDDLVVHRPTELRVGVQDDRDRRVLLLRRLIAAFETAGRAVEDDFRHRNSIAKRRVPSTVRNGSAHPPAPGTLAHPDAGQW